jgi:hypothetical protein
MKSFNLFRFTLVNCCLLPAQAASFFNRVATYPVCQQLDPTCNVDTETVAEIAAVSQDGNTIVYTDGPMESIGKHILLVMHVVLHVILLFEFIF